MNTADTMDEGGGLRRALFDRLIGPGAGSAEVGLALASGLAAAVLVPALAQARGADWSAAQLVVSGLLAFDLFGGVAVNASEAARRFYHRPGRGRGDHLAFVAAHALHVVLVAWLFRASDSGWAAGLSAVLLAAAAGILFTPRPHRRAVAMLAYAAVVLGLSPLSPTPGMEWFVPVLFLKLLLAYLLGTLSAAAEE
jgi:hypothetical protein